MTLVDGKYNFLYYSTDGNTINKKSLKNNGKEETFVLD
jgi:hypothetical protein